MTGFHEQLFQTGPILPRDRLPENPAIAEAKRILESKNRNVDSAITVLKAAPQSDSEVLSFLFDTVLKYKCKGFELEIRKICDNPQFTNNFRGQSRLGDLYYNGLIFEKNLDLAIECYEKAIAAGAHWKAKFLFDALKAKGTADSLREMIDVGEKYAGNDPFVKIRLANAYADGLGVAQNMEKASDLLGDAYVSGQKWIGHQYADILAKSGNKTSLEKLYGLCNENIREDWAKRYLIKMKWSGIGCDEDRGGAENILVKLINSEYRTINQLYVLNNAIIDAGAVTLISSEQNIYHLLSICVQNGIKVSGFYSLKSSYKISDCINVETYNLQPISTPIIMTSDDYEYVFGTNIDLGNNSIFVLNSRNPEINRLLVDNPIKNSPVKIIRDGTNYLFEQSDIFPCATIDDLCSTLTSHPEVQFQLEIKDWLDVYIKLYREKKSTKNLIIDLDKWLLSKGLIYITYFNFTIKNISDFIFEYLLGKTIYETLAADECRYIFQMMTGIGDDIRRLGRLNAYKKFNNYCTVKAIVRNRSNDIPKIYGYDFIELSDLEANSLSLYIRLNHLYDQNNIFVIEPWIARNTEKITVSFNYGEYNDDLHLFGTNIPAGTPYDAMVYEPISIQAPIIENSVLLNPNGFTIFSKHPGMKKRILDLFDFLSENLNERGFTVYSNVSSDKDIIIKGTKTIRYSLRELVTLSRYYKHIVTLETSIAELLSQTNCNLTVITVDAGYFKNVAKVCNSFNCMGVEFHENDTESETSEKYQLILTRILDSKPVVSLTGSEQLYDYSNEKQEKTVNSYIIDFCEKYPDASKKLLGHYKLLPLDGDYSTLLEISESMINHNQLILWSRLVKVLEKNNCGFSREKLINMLDEPHKQKFIDIFINSCEENLRHNDCSAHGVQIMSKTKLTLDSQQHVVCATDGEIPQFDIVGCCVSRDIFGITKDNGIGIQYPSYVDVDSTNNTNGHFYYQINYYYQGCPISINYSPHQAHNLKPSDLPVELNGAFKKWLCASFNKDIENTLENSYSNWLIVDFRSEAYRRMDIHFKDGTTELCCGMGDLHKGAEYLKKLDFIESIEIIPPEPLVDEAAMDAFISFVTKRYGKHIILIEARDSFYTITSEGNVKQNIPNNSYIMMQSLYSEYFLRKTGCYYVKCPYNVCADALQKWGFGSVHYMFEYYQYALKAIQSITSIQDDVMIGKQLDLQYAEACSKISSIMCSETESLGNALKRAESYLKESKVDQALELYTKLSESGEPLGYFNLGTIYKNGKYVEKNRDLALEYLRKASDAGIVTATNYLFDMLWDINDGEARKEMIDRIMPVAVKGNGGSLLRLGRAYRYNRGVPQNIDVALELYREAYVERAFNSDIELADFLLSIHSADSICEYISVIKQSSEKGNSDAMIRLSRAYRDGIGVEKNLDLAVDWAKKASEKNGHFLAEYKELAEKGGE